MKQGELIKILEKILEPEVKQAQITKIRNIKSGISTLLTGIKNYMRISEKKLGNKF